MAHQRDHPPSSSSSSPNKSPAAEPTATTLTQSLRDQPMRRSRLGGVLTRQPDYEQRHLEMMRYLASLRSGDKDAATQEARSMHHTTSAYKMEAAHRYHESEVQRLRSLHNGKMRFRDLESVQKNQDGASRKTKIVDDDDRDIADQYDPVTGLPRRNLGTLNLKNIHNGVSPWQVLQRYIAQSFRSKAVLVFVLGFVVLLNLRRLLVLFQVNVGDAKSMMNVTKQVVDVAVV